ncbi:GntR family transcriptional regulator [Streptomyces sp. NPDC085932]|uniref:GntR family transcriptional regulator n=1 Tax=Streptomyces sp. NPDC085932 TaxID=3365741 RepID=UPI0037D0EBEA
MADIAGRQERARRTGPKSERVYRTIREWIAEGRYSPGSKLPFERRSRRASRISRSVWRTPG